MDTKLIETIYLPNYSIVGDVSAFIIATTFIFILRTFVGIKDKTNGVMLLLLFYLDIASICNILLYAVVPHTTEFEYLAYTLYSVYLIILAYIYYAFFAYYWSIVYCSLEIKKKNIHYGSIFFHFYLLIRVLNILTHDLTIANVYLDNIVVICWVLYFSTLGIQMLYAFWKYDKTRNLTHRMIRGTAFITYILLIISLFVLHTTALITILYLVTLLTVAWYKYSYSYNILTGTVNEKGLIHYLLKNCKGKPYNGTIVEFITNEDIDTILSHVNNQLIMKNIMVFTYKTNNQCVWIYQNSVKEVESTLKDIFDTFKKPYLASTFSNIISAETILDVINGVYDTYIYSGQSKWNVITESDVEKYIRMSMIKAELLNICDKKDLNDNRVVVYCQPLYNTDAKVFDTAEALMRLELPNLGFVYPNEFIPLAEKYHLIHDMSLIILNKVCKFIEFCNHNNYILDRISINLSMEEFNNSNICNEILSISQNYDMNYSQLAIELTESLETTIDTNVLKHYLLDMKKEGIKIYLDDFGTGYSNFARIYQLPFDVIKFDMTLLKDMNKKNSEAINSVIPYFKNTGFQLVHEGIETEKDEVKCIKLGFDYLQGYKYSKPIPLDNLVGFLEKK